jgi:hypothetical protein
VRLARCSLFMRTVKSILMWLAFYPGSRMDRALIPAATGTDHLPDDQVALSILAQPRRIARPDGYIIPIMIMALSRSAMITIAPRSGAQPQSA